MKKSYTLFQWTLIGLMMVSVLLNNKVSLLICLGGFLLGFIEPRQKRKEESA